MTGFPASGGPVAESQPPPAIARLARGQLPDPGASAALQEPPASGPPATSRELPAPDEISGALREILAGPDFATFDAPVSNPFLRVIVDRLMAVLEWILEVIDRAPGLASVLAVLIPALALLAAGAIIVRRRRGAVRRTADGQESELEQTPVTPSEWLRLASRRAGEGHLRSAATALYQGFLLTLEQRGTLAFHPSKTPGDYALEIARGYSAGTDTRAGGQFLSSFQGFSFGQEDPSDDGYADLARLAREAGCPAGEQDGRSRDDTPADGPETPAGDR